jgi:hypothetical protein
MMILLPVAATVACAAIGVSVLWRDRRSFDQRLLAAALFVLALEQVFAGLSLRAVFPNEIIQWQRLKLFVEAAVPGLLLAFSLSYARSGVQMSPARWRRAPASVFVLPVALAVLFPDALFEKLSYTADGWRIHLAWSGYAVKLVSLLVFVLTLVNLEKTLRASAGRARWQIKYMIFGLGGLGAFCIYTHSQTLLFSSVDATLEPAQGAYWSSPVFS